MRKSLRMLESVLVGNEASAQEAPRTVWMQSDNGRSEVPSFDQQQNESDDNVNEHDPKGTRGKTTLEGVRRMPKNRRIKVRSNLLRQPVGLEAKTFSNYCGVVVRADCPLNYSNWSKVPRATKRDIINHMKQKFLYPASITSWLNKSMSKKWRDYKSDLKKRFFYPKKSEEFNIANCPSDVQVNQWQYLVNFWMSEEGKKLEKTTKNSRACQKITHTTGSKTFARKRDELDLEAGEPVGNIKFYEATHTRKDGSYLDPEVPAIVELAKAKKIEKLQTQTASSDIFMEELEIIYEVTGPPRNGRVRGLGLGPTPTSVFGPKAYISSSLHSEEDFINLQREVIEQRALINEQSEMMKNMKDQMTLILTCLQQKNDAAATSIKVPKPNSNAAATSTKRPKPNTEPAISAKPNDAMKVKSVAQTSQTMGKAFVPNVVSKAQVKTHVGLGMPDIATTKMKGKNAQVIMQKDDGAQVLKDKVVGSRPSFKSPVGSSPAVIGHRHVPSLHSSRGLRGAEYVDIASRFINEQNASTTPTFNNMVHRRAASFFVNTHALISFQLLIPLNRHI